MSTQPPPKLLGSSEVWLGLVLLVIAYTALVSVKAFGGASVLAGATAALGVAAVFVALLCTGGLWIGRWQRLQHRGDELFFASGWAGADASLPPDTAAWLA